MATNLWENADLESGIADWNDGLNSTISSDSSIYWEGAKSLKCVVPSNGTVEFRSDVKYIVEESTIYNVSAYWYVTNADLEMVIVVKDQDGNFINNGLVSGTADTWHRVTCAFQTGAGDTGIKIEFQKFGSTSEVGDFYIDGVMAEIGSSTSSWVNYPSGPTDTELVVADIDIDLAFDAPVVTHNHMPVVLADITHALAFEAPVLTQAHVLAVNDAAIALAFDAPALTQAHTLVVADADIDLAFESPAASEDVYELVVGTATVITLKAVIVT